jgi:hypothetical protein
MKKLLLLYLLVTFFAICKSDAQVTGETKGWPSVERYAFISSCINTAKENMSEDSARFYCYCMQEKIEIKFPTIEQAGTITKEDMSTPEWQKEIEVCLGGFWGTAEREAFISNCISSANNGGLAEEKAKNYCECMLYKIEVRFPDPLEAGELTAEKLATPEWKKITQGCIDF